jgi:hypothetical protein
MPEPLLALITSDWIAIGSACIAALSLVVSLTTAWRANRLAVTFSRERIERRDQYIEIHTRVVNNSQFAVRIVEVNLEDESGSHVAKRDERAPTAGHPVVVAEHVPKEIDARQGRVFHVRWDPNAVTLNQRVRTTFRTDNDKSLDARWHEIPEASGS